MALNYTSPATIAPEVPGLVSRQALFTKTGTGGQYAELLISSGTASTGRKITKYRAPAFSQSQQKIVGRPSPRIQLAFKSCISAIEGALNSEDDPILKANAINDLREALGRLWDAKADRGKLFGNVIALLRGLLLGVQPENLPPEHMKAIRRVIRETALTPAVNAVDLKNYTQTLTKAGCDVFRDLR